MQFVPSTYHNFLKYIHDGVVNYVPEDDDPYSHCNIAGVPKVISLPYAHFFMTYLPKIKYLVNNEGKILSYTEKEKQAINYLESVGTLLHDDTSSHPKINTTP